MLREQHSQPRVLKGTGCVNPPKSKSCTLSKQVGSTSLILSGNASNCLQGTSHPAPLQPGRDTRTHENPNSPVSSPTSTWLRLVPAVTREYLGECTRLQSEPQCCNSSVGYLFQRVYFVLLLCILAGVPCSLMLESPCEDRALSSQGREVQHLQPRWE